MKLITYLITILAVLGSYTSLHSIECADGEAICNDGKKVTWSCVYKFPTCQARDYGDSQKAAETLCKDHGGVNYWHYNACFA